MHVWARCIVLSCALNLLLQGRYLKYIPLPICNPAFGKANLVNGIAVTPKPCQTPYTALNGSAAYW